MLAVIHRASIGWVVGWALIAGAAQAADAPLGDLLGQIAGPDEAARLAAIDKIGALGDDAAQAVEPLAGLLADPSVAVRAHAALALGQIGEPAKSAGPALVKLLADPDEAVRRQAVAALGAIRPGTDVTLPAFVALMRDADPGVRVRAMQAVAEAGSEAVPALIKATEDKEAAYWACLVLRELGPAAKDAVPALTALLTDARVEIRREALLTLAAVGDAAESAIPQIVPLLADEGVRVAAIYALASIGSVPEEALSALRENAESSDPLLSTVSTWALARLAPEDMELRRTATEKLVAAIQSDDPFVRVTAARGLASLPPAPDVTLPIIEKALANADPATVQHAADAIASLGPAALPQIVHGLEIPAVRIMALQVLGQLGPEAASATDAVAALLSNEDPDVAVEAALTLAKIGPSAAGAVPSLVQALVRKEEGVAPSAAYALGQIGPDAAAAQDALIASLESADSTTALASAWALTKVAPVETHATRVVPVLAAGLQAASPMLRKGAAEALGSLGPLAKDAAAALEKAAQDEEDAVKAAAVEALKLVQASKPEPAPVPVTPAAPSTVIERGSKVWTVKEATPLRGGENVLGQLPKGTPLTVLDVKGPWLGVRVEGEGLPKAGWVHQTHVGTTAP